MKESSTQAKTGQNRALLVIIIVLLCITLAAVGVTAWTLLTPKTQMLMPDYAPQEEDKNAVSIPGEIDQEKEETPEGKNSMSLVYSPEVTVSLSTKKIAMMFQNPSSSTSDVVLQLVVQDEVLAESGKLVPGKMLQSLDLMDGADKKLQPGTYNAFFVVQPYDAQSAEKAMINSKCEITVNVLP